MSPANPTSPAPADAWTLLGMKTRAAWVIAGQFVFAYTLLAVTSWGTIESKWPVVLAWVLATGTVVCMLATKPDPLPLWASVAIGVAIPVSCAIVLAVLPVPRSSAGQTWVYAVASAIVTYLCVRGRIATAWLSTVATIVVALYWSLGTGQGVAPGLTISIFALGPLAMGTVFSFTLRPAARTVFELREQATERVAEQAATSALLEERDFQLRQLDQLVRPTLEKIAQGEPVESAMRLECGLLEAELRDSLRAPSLVDIDVSVAARRARTRGVEVVLVDDGGSDDVTPNVRERLLGHVVSALDGANAGSVTVRVLPPNRPVLATILVRDPARGSRRIELDHEGQSISTGSDDTSSWVKKL